MLTADGSHAPAAQTATSTKKRFSSWNVTAMLPLSCVLSHIHRHAKIAVELTPAGCYCQLQVVNSL